LQAFELAQVKIWFARPPAVVVALKFGAMSAPSPRGSPRPAAICEAQVPLIGPGAGELKLPEAQVLFAAVPQ
jgi:hypothetical protein